MKVFHHQSLADLAASVESALARFDVALRTDAVDRFDSDSIRPIWKRLCEVLLDYCSYRLAPVTGVKVDPFDDPYVGALLMTDQGHVIAAHRKETHHEPHAEAITLLSALAAVPGAVARGLCATIEDSYAKKAWLHSPHGRQVFVEQFAKAGRLVRESLSGGSARPKLVLLSTLEPCRDFESQPGCAHLITAFRPDLVLYASDDTNAKGQGGPVIRDAGLSLLTNLAVERNIAINLLFYSSVHCIDRLLRESAHSHDMFALRYMVVQLDRLKPITSLVQESHHIPDRICINFDGSRLPVYQAPIEIRAPKAHIDDVRFDLDTVDPHRVLIINQFHTDFLLTYCQEHVICTGRLPGVLICSRGISDAEPARGQEADVLVERLRCAGVRVYTDVLRKVDEHFLAQQAIARWSSPALAREFLYLLAKTDRGYRAVSGTPERVKQGVLGLSGVRRISVYLEVHSRNALFWVLRTLKARGAFEADGVLAASSVGIVLLSDDQGAAARSGAEILSFLREQDLGPRVLVETQRLGNISRRSAIELRDELISGAIDPIYIGGDALSRVLHGDSWKDRGSAGLLLDAAARRDPVLYEELILKRLPSSIDVEDWQKTCSVLNALAKFGRPPLEDLPLMFAHARRFGGALATTLDRGSRAPILLDLVWRFMSAAHAVAHTVEELENLLGFDALEVYIADSPFLLKELVLYANRSPLPPTEALRALERALVILDEHLPHLPEPDRASVLLRVNRLAALWDVPGSAECQARVEAITAKWPHAVAECLEEADRCRRIMHHGLTGVFSGSLAERTKSFASYLFLRTTKSALRRGEFRGLFTGLQTEFRNLMLSRQFHPSEEVLSWRGDKTPLARLLLSEIPRHELLDHLRILATDEDDTIRWAALVLAMDFGHRQLLLASAAPSKHSALELREQTATVLGLALSRYHYWLHREFLQLFLNEHAPSNPLPAQARIQFTDLGPLRELVFAPITADTHPEVATELRRVREHVRRIALILPPLDTNAAKAVEPSANGGTPALGLGSIGSYLLSRGHDVEILDFHRHPSLVRDLPERVRYRDFIGFSVVASTFAATRRVIWILRSTLGAGCPIIVLGGHGPTLQQRDFMDDLTFQWDYLVLGDGEFPFAQIVEGKGVEHADSIPGVLARRDSGSSLSSHHLHASVEWDALPWIDRRLFVAPTGVPYEPSPTRDHTHVEAHVVMSRGCDWHCVFCTEAILRGKHGEARRSVPDVAAEVRYLVSAHNVDRIHFIDDNLLPQIAAGRCDAADSVAWSRDLLKALGFIRSEACRAGRTFGWRGLFRLEDFIRYTEMIPNLYELLGDSGCLLLAFGIETGNEERRRRLKGLAVSNETIKSVVATLAHREILSKGYFMIGGLNETEATASETIRFSISSGLSLAYFALYKNFRGLINASRERREDAASRESTYMTFATLRDDLSALIEQCNNSDDLRAIFGNGIDEVRLKEAKQAVTALKQMGFGFRDLFKYNDFHENMNVANEVLGVWSSPDPRDCFIRSTRRAYFEFYARKEFVDVYRALIERGY